MSEEDVERILRVAGIASAPLDPSSLEALRQLSRERQQAAHASATTEAVGTRTSSLGSFASAKAVDPVLSDSSMVMSSVPKNSGGDEVTSHMLAQMLQVQTKLLMDTQQQLKKLTQKVDSLEEQLLYASGGGNGAGATTFAKPPGKATAGVGAAQDPAAMNMHMNMNRNNIPMQPGQLQLEAWYETFCPTFLKRLIVLGQLFWTESKGVVRPFDTALLFKVVCMCLVAYGRTSSARKKLQQQKHADDPSWFLFVRINAKWFFLVFGLLYHTRYLHFLYQFVYVDNYPMRVLWYGEDMGLDHPLHEDDDDVDDEHQDQDPHNGGQQQNGRPHHRRNPRLRRRRHGQPHNGQENQPAWWRAWIQETFLMGVIQPRQPNLQDGGGDVPPPEGVAAAQENVAPGEDPPPFAPQDQQDQPQQQQQPPVAPNLILVAIQDILYLFGSFFLSLFVVWHPRRPQDAPADAGAQPEEPAAQQPPQERQQQQQEQEDIDNIDE